MVNSASLAALLATAFVHPVEALRRSRRSKSSKNVSVAGFADYGYDCNGDGVQDCNSWDSVNGLCNNMPMCRYQWKSGDYTSGQSCRCNDQCYDQPDSAAANAPNDFVDILYGRWRPWNKLADTCATWLVPKNDEDLAAILQYAKQNQYTVRPAGATHSAGGIVTDWEDARNVLAVSLAEYQAPGEWEYTFKEQSTGKATVVVNAGWTPMHLYSRIRPRNYFLPTQTAGPVFQLGGLVANCVHGGNYQKGFLHEYVVRMRVMLHNGTIRVIDDESELRFWRNSYGLLGFITGLEFSLDYRPKFQTYFKQQKINWNEEDFWTFLKQEAHADISEVDAPAGKPGDRQALMGQFFFNPYEAGETPEQTSISAVIWRANENATLPGVPDTCSRWTPCETAYKYPMEETIDDETRPGYKQPFVEAVRHWGGPQILPTGFDENELLAPNARFMTSTSMTGPGALLAINSATMNDGFYAYDVPNVVYGAYFIKPKDIFQAWNVLVENFMARKDDEVFPWNGPPELRFLTVSDDAVLNPVPAGVYAVSEYLAFPVPGRTDQGWKSAFKDVQDAWGDQFGGKPHIGKFWGFGTAADGTMQPYQSERACQIYSDAQKDIFNAYRRQADPDNLFAGGDAMKLLAAC